MGYRPQRYLIYDRAWSLLYHLYRRLLVQTHLTQELPLYLEWEKPRETNFLPRQAVADPLFPLFTAECLRGGVSRVPGRRTELWQVEIRVHDEMNVRGRGLNADIYAMLEDSIEQLDGAAILYYEYSRFPSGYGGDSQHANYRVASRDFQLRFVGWSRGSEESERDRNAVRIQFEAEI